MLSWDDVKKGYDNLRKLYDDAQELYSSTDGFHDFIQEGIDAYNGFIRTAQRYFANEPMEDENDYKLYNLLDQLGVPRNDLDELKRYMERYGLDWSDLRTTKVLQMFGGQMRRSNALAMNFVSKNVERLYR